jgi:hypothetical protein
MIHAKFAAEMIILGQASTMACTCGIIARVAGHWDILQMVDTGISMAKGCLRRSMSLIVIVPLSRGNAMTKSTIEVEAGATGLTEFLGLLQR